MKGKKHLSVDIYLYLTDLSGLSCRKTCIFPLSPVPTPPQNRASQNILTRIKVGENHMRLSGHEILIHSFRQGQEFLQSEVPGKLKNTKWTKVLICKKCDANWPRNLLTVHIISAQMLGFVSDIPTLCVRERETVFFFFFWLLFLRSETSGGRTLGQI